MYIFGNIREEFKNDEDLLLQQECARQRTVFLKLKFNLNLIGYYEFCYWYSSRISFKSSALFICKWIFKIVAWERLKNETNNHFFYILLQFCSKLLSHVIKVQMRIGFDLFWNAFSFLGHEFYSYIFRKLIT